MNIIVDEMWYIVEYLLMDIFSFLVVIGWNKSKMIIIQIQHFIKVHNHV